MPLLGQDNLAEMMARGAKFRSNPAGTKLNDAEFTELTALVEKRSQNTSEFIRELVLRELRWDKEEGHADPLLAEIVGVRLLLVNILRPLAAGQKVPFETFDKLLDQIKILKHELSGKLLSESRKPGE